MLDHKRFRPVLFGQEPIRYGDIFLFGREHEPDFHKLHLAIFLGEFVGNIPLLLHATNHPSVRQTKPTGGVIYWPYSEFSKHRKYVRLYGVRRLRS